MDSIYNWIIPLFWTAWAAYWIASARKVQKTRQAELHIARFAHLTLTVMAFALIALPRIHVGPLGWRVLPKSHVVVFVGAAIVAAGLGFATWARVHLGYYWSGTITLKEGHRLVRTGPYGWVRHPIYTGFLTGVLGTAVAVGELRGIVAFVILVAVYLLKIRREEAWLVREFGEEYARYRREVNALVPLPRLIQRNFWLSP